MKSRKREFRVLVRDRRTNDVKQLYRRPGGGFRASRRALDRGYKFSREEARDASRWASKRGLAAYVTKSPYPFLVLDSDTKMVRHDLARKLNTLARNTKRYMWIGEGWRSSSQQWAFWRDYLARGKRPPLVAYPGTSNHESGWAADASFLLSGRGGAYVNLGNYKRPKTVRRMKRLGLGLPVPGEPWHTEITTAWRA